MFPDYLSVSYDCVLIKIVQVVKNIFSTIGFVIYNKPPLKKGTITHD